MIMELEIIIGILVVAVLLLCGCFFYLYQAKKKARAYEEKLIREIKFENKLKREAEKEQEVPKEMPTIKNQPQMNIAAMLDQMAADLEGQNKDKVIDFEQEQEETSIISYKELKKAVETFTEDEELAQEQSPISVKEVLNLRHEEEEPIFQTIDDDSEPMVVEEVKEKEVHPVLQEKKKFQNTEFISPIYGKQEQKADYPHIPVMSESEEVLSVLPEQEPSVEVQDEEAFLNELRDFRNQL